MQRQSLPSARHQHVHAPHRPAQQPAAVSACSQLASGWRKEAGAQRRGGQHDGASGPILTASSAGPPTDDLVCERRAVDLAYTILELSSSTRRRVLFPRERK